MQRIIKRLDNDDRKAIQKAYGEPMDLSYFIIYSVTLAEDIWECED